MMEKDILIHDDVLDRFALLNQRNRLAHAYLLAGPQFIGKAQTALSVAKMVNCENSSKDDQKRFCDSCASCSKINAGSHPDVHIIDRQDEQTIKIEQIRELLAQMKLRSFEAKVKVFILKDIERMTLESSNALLKCLEEPTANSLLLLTTAVPEKVLATIESRCHKISLFPLSVNRLTQWLSENTREPKDSVKFLAHFAQGCLGKAEILRGEDFFRQKNLIIDRFIFSGEDESFIKKILADKKKAKEFLDILLTWISDCVLHKCGICDDRLTHTDRIKDLKKFQEQYSFEELKLFYKEIVNIQKLLADNLNAKIPLMIIKEWLYYGKINTSPVR
jgi:DNA polymerase III subunit delta'